MQCHISEGLVLHTFWDCTALATFWLEFKTSIKDLNALSLPDSPATYLLHDTFHISDTKTLLRHLLNAVKACILVHWKSTDLPITEHWRASASDIYIILIFPFQMFTPRVSLV